MRNENDGSNEREDFRVCEEPAGANYRVLWNTLLAAMRSQEFLEAIELPVEYGQMMFSAMLQMEFLALEKILKAVMLEERRN